MGCKSCLGCLAKLTLGVIILILIMAVGFFVYKNITSLSELQGEYEVVEVKEVASFTSFADNGIDIYYFEVVEAGSEKVVLLFSLPRNTSSEQQLSLYLSQRTNLIAPPIATLYLNQLVLIGGELWHIGKIGKEGVWLGKLKTSLSLSQVESSPALKYKDGITLNPKYLILK